MKDATISLGSSLYSVNVANSHLIHSSSVSHTTNATSHLKETPQIKHNERDATSSNSAVSGGVIAGCMVALLVAAVAAAVGIAGVWR